MATNLGAGEQDSEDGNREKVLVVVRHSHRSAAHEQRSAEDQRCISILILDERKKSTMHARCHDGWSTQAGARTAAIAGACRQSCRRALRWPAPAEPRAESGTAARTAGSRGGRPGPATTEVHRHARRYARRAGQAAGERTDERALGRHEAASRADQAAGAHRSAQSARLDSTERWADGAASRRGRCAPWPATGCATLGRLCQTPRACVDRSAIGKERTKRAAGPLCTAS